ncbi:MAG: hypothetical protein VW333_09825, partial [Pseudomonadales bacterium]
WRTVDFAAIEDVRDKVYDHENQIHGNPDMAPPVTGLIERVDDLEGRVDSIVGTDPDDHVTQDELNTALYGTGTSPSTADDGVYAAIQDNTDLIEEINTTTIPELDGRVTTNEGDISTNASDISAIKTQLTPTSHETILTSVDNGDGTFSTTWAANVHDGGVLIDNTDPWDHGQYNTLNDAVIQNDGTPTPRAMLGNLHLNANQRISPSAGALLCVVTADAPTVNGVYANLLLAPNVNYDFSSSVWEVKDINESKWLYVRLLSDGGKWHQVGAHYVGEPGGLGDDSGVYQSHYNVSQEPQTITSDRNAVSAGPVQIQTDHLITIEPGAVWAIV